MSALSASPGEAIIELTGLGPRMRQPLLAVYALDHATNLVAAFPVGRDGRFALSQEILGQAHQVVIGPRTDDWNRLAHCGPVFYPAELFERMLVERGVFQIARKTWLAWSFVRPHPRDSAVADEAAFHGMEFQILIY